MFNKSQIEIIGLLMIVVLATMGLLFALYFVISPAREQVITTQESILAANWLNTMLGTTTECNDRSVKELLQDCALGGQIQCIQSTDTTQGQNSCKFAQNTINTMLDKTFGSWNTKYNFFIEGTNYVTGIKFGNDCPGEREAKTHVIPIASGLNIKITLQLCH